MSKRPTLDLNPNLVDMMNRICSEYPLADILHALSRECLGRTRDLLNQGESELNQTRAETWLEFERRIKHLASSASRKKQGVVGEKLMYSMKKVKER